MRKHAQEKRVQQRFADNNHRIHLSGSSPGAVILAIYIGDTTKAPVQK